MGKERKWKKNQIKENHFIGRNTHHSNDIFAPIGDIWMTVYVSLKRDIFCTFLTKCPRLKDVNMSNPAACFCFVKKKKKKA